MLKQPIMK